MSKSLYGVFFKLSVRVTAHQKSKTALVIFVLVNLKQFVFYKRISVKQDKTLVNLVAIMSSDEEIAICMWYTLHTLEEGEKKLWVHPLNQKENL